VRVAHAAGLGGPIEASPPADEASAWTVTQIDNRWPVHKDQLAIDPRTGSVTARQRFTDYPLLAELSSPGIQAHMGLLFGPINQLALAGTAIGLLTMILWGYRMWWQRRPTRADRRLTLGRPPARGTWQGLPPTVLIPAVVVVAAVGWALPMLGVSLLGFLVVDAVAGRRRGRRSALPRES
jgi:uncharacterized iron-regulated membrane protein